MSSPETKKIRAAAGDLVSRILQRGRLQQQELEGKLKVKDGGVNWAKQHFVEEILLLARTEAVSLADRIIGKNVGVRMQRESLMDEDLVPNPGDKAVRDFQSRQRVVLASYQNPGHRASSIKVDDNRISIKKNYKELDGEPGTDQLSENEA